MLPLRAFVGIARSNGRVAVPLWRAMREISTGSVGGNASGREPDQGDLGPSSLLEAEMRMASEAVWPTSGRQRKFGARVQGALANIIMSNVRFREELVDQLGLGIEEVRMSPDLSIAHVLWESCTGEGDALERRLSARKGALRTALAKALHVRRVPELVFKRNQLSDKERELQRLLQEADLETRSGS